MWRSTRYKPGEFETILRQLGKISSLFKSPGLSMKHFMVDWLHAMDIGVSQTILGNVLWESLDMLFPGISKKLQVTELWKKLRAWYKDNKPPAQFDALTIEMLKLPGKGPKLRSKAAECRYLLPFGVLVARECNDGSQHRVAVCGAMESLFNLAVTMSTDPYNSDQAVLQSRRVGLLLVSLETEATAQGDELSWRVKPKLHMMQELIEYLGPELGSARFFWTYQDESWGGWLSNTAARRGGPKHASTVALGLLSRWRCLVSAKL